MKRNVEEEKFSQTRGEIEKERNRKLKEIRGLEKGKLQKVLKLIKSVCDFSALWSFTSPLPPSLPHSYLSLINIIVLGLCFCLPSWKVNFFHQPQHETTFGSPRLSLLPCLSNPPSLSLPPSPSSIY